MKFLENVGTEYEEEVKGFEVLRNFGNSLLDYYAEGHGDETFIKGQINGFVECLVAVGMLKEENYMFLIEEFAEAFKKLKTEMQREF